MADEIIVYQIHISTKDLPLELQERIIEACLSKVININENELLDRIVNKAVKDKLNHKGEPTSHLFTANTVPKPKEHAFRFGFPFDKGEQ